MGLVATNTVAQGDTREVGLDAMAAAGFTITRAIQSRSWPASSANLEYAAVWGTVAVSYTHLRAHETVLDLVCRLLLEKKKTQKHRNNITLHH